NGPSHNRTNGCLAPTFALRLRPYARRAAPRQPFVLSLSKDEQRQHPFHSHYGLTPVSLASFSALNSASDVYHLMRVRVASFVSRLPRARASSGDRKSTRL